MLLSSWTASSHASKGDRTIFVPLWLALACSGLPQEKTNGEKTMVVTDERTFGFHALRHSLARFLVSKDVDPKKV